MSKNLPALQKSNKVKTVLAAREKAVSDMNIELREKYDTMATRLDEEVARGLNFYHWLGTQVNAIVSNTDNVYGSGAMKKISEAWTMDPSMLYKAKAFSDAYSEKELKHLCRLKTAAGTVVGWGHVIQLIGIPKKARVTMQERVIDEALTTKELAALVKKRYGPRRTGSGRPFMRPKTVRAGLVQLRTVSSQWMSRNGTVWNGQDYSLFQELEDLPPEELTHEMVDELEQVSKGQRSMSEACIENASSADRLMDQVKTVLQKREQELATEIRGERSPSKADSIAGTVRRARGRGMASGNAPQK